MYKFLTRTLVVGALATMMLTSANAGHVNCGDTLTSGTTVLDSNMICPGTALFLDGPGPVLDSMTLDCAGNSITAGGLGIGITGTGVTVRNCTIISAGQGIAIRDGSNHRIADNVISATAVGIFVRQDVTDNIISGNNIHSTNDRAIFQRAGSGGNVFTGNTIVADTFEAVRFWSSSNNQLTENTITSPVNYVQSSKTFLTNGGMSVHPINGKIFAVESNFGSSIGFGVGTSTAFFEVDLTTGVVLSAAMLTLDSADVGFGFDALEIMDDGRILAMGGLFGNRNLYEIAYVMGNSTAELTLVDITGLGTSVPWGSGGHVNGLQQIGPNRLLGTTQRGDLVQIDLPPDEFTSGTATLVRPYGQGIGGGWADLAVDPISGLTFLLTRYRFEATGTSHLYTIVDPMSSNPAVHTPVHVGDTGLIFFSDIDFAADGTLYGNAYSPFRVNVSTGAATIFGPFGNEVGFGPDTLEPPSANTQLTNNTFLTADGSVRYPGTITLPPVDIVDITTQRVDIGAGRVFVDSGALPFLDVLARIELDNLVGPRVPLVDDDDDGIFATCVAPRCTNVSFASGTLAFDVTGFTTYSHAPEAVDFSDGPQLLPFLASSGTIISLGDQTLTFSEEPNPDGVRITASGGAAPARVRVCSAIATLTIGAGNDVVFTCGSVMLDVLNGITVLEVTIDDETAIVSVPAGNVLIYEPETDTTPATFEASEDNPDTVVVLVGGAEIPVAPGESFTLVPFGDFSADMAIGKRRFEIKGEFTLGIATDDIEPLTEDVTVKVGTLVMAIPAGLFVDSDGTFKFAGVIDRVMLEVKITPLGGNDFGLNIEAGTRLAKVADPFDVTLTIGDDAGSVIAMAE